MNICIGDASLAPDTPLLDTTYPFVHTNKLHLGQLCSLLYVHFCRDSQILCSVEASSQSKNLKDGSRVRSNASIDGGGLKKTLTSGRRSTSSSTKKNAKSIRPRAKFQLCSNTATLSSRQRHRRCVSDGKSATASHRGNELISYQRRYLWRAFPPCADQEVAQSLFTKECISI